MYDLDDEIYHTSCKVVVGTNYSLAEQQGLREKLQPIAIPWEEEADPPVHLSIGRKPMSHWYIAKRDDDRSSTCLFPSSLVLLCPTVEMSRVSRDLVARGS
jgi:hypothetical protein